MKPRAADQSRVLVGIAVQPVVAAMLAFSTFSIVAFTGRLLYGGRPADPVDSAISFAFGVGIVGLLVTVFAATPMLLWLQTRGPVTRRQVLACGAILGNLPSVLIVLSLAPSRANAGALTNLDQLTYGLLGAIRALAFGTFMGVASATVFWWIARRSLTRDPRFRLATLIASRDSISLSEQNDRHDQRMRPS